MSQISSFSALLRASRELRLLHALARPGDESLSGVATDGIDWDDFVWQSQRHGLAALSYSRLHALDAGAVPRSAMTSLEQDYRLGQVRFLAQAHETCRITKMFCEEGIDSLVLKGVAAAHRLYAADPAVRQSTDIDLIVAPDNFLAADKILRRDGYVRKTPNFEIPKESIDMLGFLLHAFEYEDVRNGHSVEVHHRLTANPHAMIADFGELSRSALVIETSAGCIRGMNDADAARYLCSHGGGHAFAMLKWLCDVERAFHLIGRDGVCALRYSERAAFTGNAIDLARSLLDDANQVRPTTMAAARRNDRNMSFVVAQLCADEIPGGLRTSKSVLRELEMLRFQVRMGGYRAFAMNDLVRFLCDARDALTLRRGLGWLPLYILLGPFLALRRFLTRV